jgi:four helix bundle protein
MNNLELKSRTKSFAIQVFLVTRKFPKNIETTVIIKQIIRSASSIAANYRSACKAKSLKDFAFKIRTIEEESDETCFWLEMMTTLYPEFEKEINPLLKESDELARIFAASYKTAKQNLNGSK